MIEGVSTEAVQSGSGDWFGPSFLLERSKLEPPAPRPGTVRRSALLRRLHGELAAPLLSVAAPPGYGKSALLRQWAEEERDRVAWLSLEREDNDPAVLLAYLAAALGRVEPVDADAFRTRMPPGTSVAAIVARRIAASLSSMTGPVVLVLDHTELLTNRQCRDAIAELALHLPPNARLAVASRGAPPIPLAGLRSRGAVAELEAADLAMDTQEARQLIEGVGVGLDDDDLAELVMHTEGWPVGLYLAALALKAGDRSSATRFVYTGDDRLVADYLRTELLARVPRGRLSFLTRTSVLERMCGSLCDAVLGRTRSGRILEGLEESNMLVVPLDRRREWYRYHKLFQQMLRVELDQREGELVAGLHVRAARWCEENGLPDLAIEHAQAAGDADRVARLVATHILPAYAGGRLETVRGWCQWFDDRGLVERYPAVAVVGGVLRTLTGEPGGAERWAAAAEAAPADEPMPDGSTMESWRALLRAYLCRRGLARMRADAQTASAGLAPGSRWLPSALVLATVVVLPLRPSKRRPSSTSSSRTPVPRRSRSSRPSASSPTWA